eukprot:scaffold13486_cov55-Phaeocystis_antarctica.AAC.2
MCRGHVEHGAHGCDAGRVEGQRLVERRRVLPSGKEGVRCGARCGPGAGGHGRAAAHEWHAREEGPAVLRLGRYRACAERTLNMPLMVVTLDVSKPNGWLNFDAFCGVERRVYDAGRGAGCGRREGVGRRQCTSGDARREGPAVKAGGARACVERTENMAYMVVTLDVSKLSGWLNAVADCRVKRRAYDAERGVGWEAGGRGPSAAHERHARREGPAVKAGGAIEGMRGAHGEHGVHGCDARRVEAEQLVERRRVLPSRKEGVRCGARCGPGARERGPAAAHERHARQEGPAVRLRGL